MAFARRQPSWAQYPDISTGTVNNTDFNAWESELYQNARTRGQYVIYTDGGLTYGISSVTGLADVTPNADPGAVLATAITQLVSTVGGGQITLVGNLGTMSTVPTIPNGIAAATPLVIQGVGASVKLSSSAPRFMDFGITADYQTFRNFELRDITIDNDNVGGRHHVVIGNYVAGVVALRFNVQNMAVRRVRTLNVPTDSTLTNHRLNIWIEPKHAAISESTQSYLKDILIEDCRFEGGNAGITLGGTTSSGASSGTNILIDRVKLLRCWHSLGTVPTVSFNSLNFQIGQFAQVGSCEVVDCYGQYSGDVGVEIDNAQDATIKGCVIEEAYNEAFYLTNFNSPPYLAGQVVRFTECTGRRTEAAAGVFAKIGRTTGVDFGNVTFRDCSWYRNTADLGSAADAIFLNSSPNIAKLVVDNFTSQVENGSNGSTSVFPVGFSFAFGSNATNKLVCRDLKIGFSATRGTGGLTYVAAQILGTCAFDISGCDVTLAVANSTSGGTRGISLGAGTATLRGRIRGLNFPSITGDTGTRGVYVGGASTLTVTNRIIVENCDFTKIGSSGAEVFFVTGNENKNKVDLESNDMRLMPPAVTTDNSKFAATTFTSATGNQYLGLYKATLVVAGGANVTSVDVSVDGTTYVNALTQSAAVCPTLQLPFNNGDYLKITVSSGVSFPTVSVVPSR